MTSAAPQLNAAQFAIVNSLTDPEIKAAVAQFGFTTAKLNKGKALYDAALAAVNGAAPRPKLSLLSSRKP